MPCRSHSVQELGLQLHLCVGFGINCGVNCIAKLASNNGGAVTAHQDRRAACKRACEIAPLFDVRD
jgi:hypothetical protein